VGAAVAVGAADGSAGRDVFGAALDAEGEAESDGPALADAEGEAEAEAGAAEDALGDGAAEGEPDEGSGTPALMSRGSAVSREGVS
jgi:hypothetical protein